MKFLKKHLSFIFCILGLFAFRWSFADQYVVPTGSMKPTIQEGDHIFVNKMAYDMKVPFTNFVLSHTGEIQKGDVIVFQFPKDPSINFVKRVIGLPGDTIDVDGKWIKVPQDQYFVMGDNRENSWDSRYWGFVPRENIKGKALAVAWNFQFVDFVPQMNLHRFAIKL